MKKNPNISVVINPAKVGYTKVGLNPKELEQFRKKAMKRACIYVSKYVKNNHDFKNRTRRLQRAIHYTIVNKAKKGLLYVKESQAKVDSKYGDYSYAPYVFNGTGIHGGKGYYDIVPRYASALKFKVNGNWVTTMHVKHPGSAADKSFEKALVATRPRVIEIYREELDKMLKSKVLV